MEIENILPDYQFLTPIKEQLDFMVDVNNNVSVFIATMYESLIRSKDVLDEAETAVVSMLRQVIVYQDSITPLIAFGKVDVIELVIRTNLELMVQILFMTESDLNVKGLLYHYYSNAKEHNMINKYINSSDANNNIQKLGLDLNEMSIEKIKIFNDRFALLSSIIDPNAPANSQILDRIPNFKANKSWFYMYDTGLTTIEKLFHHIDWHNLYEGPYRFMSIRVHSSNVMSGRLSVKDENNFAFLDARFPFNIFEKVHSHLLLTSKFLLQFTQTYYTDYFETFQIWYTSYFHIHLNRISNLKFENT